MKIEILTIGDEILSGNIVDTNKAYLSDKLWLAGFEVVYHSGVRDDEVTITEALLLATSRSDIVIVTGGLGPTADDFTIEVAAKTFKKKLVSDPKILRKLEQCFVKLGRPLKENNKKQARIPEGAWTFDNRFGTAPGIVMDYKKVRLYFLPGVPKEMKNLFDDSVLPDILSLNKENELFFISKMLKCFGSAESDLDYALKDLYVNRTEIENVRVGFRAHFPETFIKISAWHKNKKSAQETLNQVEEKIRAKVGDYIYGEGDDTLESVTGALLAKAKKTLALAESCTGGLIANRITNIAGSSQYFLGGVVSYANEVKKTVLGVSDATLKKHGAVSSECAIEMAEGIRRLTKADFGIAVTGIAGPDGGTISKPVGTVHVALASAKGVTEKKYFFPQNREWFKLIVSSIALDCLRRELL